jgi:DNA transformation protein and related proteins
MSLSPSFAAMLEDALAPLGRIVIKRIFSSSGVYCEGILFGLASGDVLYLKADGTTQAAYEAEGCERFIARAKGSSRTMAMPYWQVPERLYDDSDELADWARTALAVALAASKKRASKAAGPPAKTPAARSKAPRRRTQGIT